MSSPQSPRAPFCSTVPASQRLPAAGLGGPSPHQVAYLPLLPNKSRAWLAWARPGGSRAQVIMPGWPALLAYRVLRLPGLAGDIIGGRLCLVLHCRTASDAVSRTDSAACRADSQGSLWPPRRADWPTFAASSPATPAVDCSAAPTPMEGKALALFSQFLLPRKFVVAVVALAVTPQRHG
jgi:hypothetical protein